MNRDWREDYVICEHVKKDTDSKTLRNQEFRVCCEDCYKKGFLSREDIHVFEKNELVYGKI